MSDSRITRCSSPRMVKNYPLALLTTVRLRFGMTMGELTGAVLVFRDITELCRQERAVQVALAYAENIIATLREPFLVLDKNLRVKTANRAFYKMFHVEKEETEGRLHLRLGQGQWDITSIADAAG